MRHRAGIGGRWLGAAALERVANIRGRGAIRTIGNAEADPYKVCVGLLDAAERQGAAIFEHTRAGRIRKRLMGRETDDHQLFSFGRARELSVRARV